MTDSAPDAADRLALDFGETSLRLLVRDARGWRLLGEVDAESDDMPRIMDDLRARAVAAIGAGSEPRVELWLPRALVHVETFRCAAEAAEAVDAAARATLAARFGAAAEALVHVAGPVDAAGVGCVAAVDPQTIVEARAHARALRFAPGRATLPPPTPGFPSGPWFDAHDSAQPAAPPAEAQPSLARPARDDSPPPGLTDAAADARRRPFQAARRVAAAAAVMAVMAIAALGGFFPHEGELSDPPAVASVSPVLAVTPDASLAADLATPAPIATSPAQAALAPPTAPLPFPLAPTDEPPVRPVSGPPPATPAPPPQPSLPAANPGAMRTALANAGPPEGPPKPPARAAARPEESAAPSPAALPFRPAADVAQPAAPASAEPEPPSAARDPAPPPGMRPKPRPDGVAERAREAADAAARAIATAAPKPRPTPPRKVAVQQAAPASPRATPPTVAREASTAGEGRSGVAAARQATLPDALSFETTALIGIFGGPSGREALLRLASGEMRKVSMGSRIDGWTVSEIGETALGLRKGGETRRLSLPRP